MDPKPLTVNRTLKPQKTKPSTLQNPKPNHNVVKLNRTLIDPLEGALKETKPSETPASTAKKRPYSSERERLEAAPGNLYRAFERVFEVFYRGLAGVRRGCEGFRRVSLFWWALERWCRGLVTV